MNRLKSTLIVLAAVLIAGAVTPRNASAQFGIGASYEKRTDVGVTEPETGFGVRIEKGILNKLPVISLAIRAHFSNFSENNSASITDGNVTYSYSQEIKDYDFGVAAIGGVNVGLVKPYVGLGLGSNTIDIERSDLGAGNPLEAEANDSKIYWNALIGAEVSPIPLIKPFVEYRFTSVGGDFFENVQQQDLSEVKSQKGRVIFGVMLRF